MHCASLQNTLKVSGAAITFCSILSTPLNLIILWVYWRTRRNLKQFHYPIINIAISDLFSGLVGLTFRGPGMIDYQSYYNGQLCHGGFDCFNKSEICNDIVCNTPTTFCLLSPYIAWAFAYQSISAAAILSLDRFMAILYPVWYSTTMDTKHMKLLVLSSWISITGYCIFHLLFYKLDFVSIVWVTEYGRCMYMKKHSSTCSPEYLDNLGSSNLQIYEEIIFFVIPVLMALGTGLPVLYTLKRRSVGQGDDTNSQCHKNMANDALVIIVNSFVPWIFYVCCLNFDGGRNQRAMIASFVFFYVSPLTNPLIISARNKTWRKAWRNLMRDTGFKKSHEDDFNVNCGRGNRSETSRLVIS